MFFVCIFSHQHISQRDLILAEFLRKAIATCDFPGGGGVRTPCPALWIHPYKLYFTWHIYGKRNKSFMAANSIG